uniref:Uncharacterized protein n=1 Tax=Strix occidentalis caurina TaxID=311401 RepID=A0A8D0EZS7_STROC
IAIATLQRVGGGKFGGEQTRKKTFCTLRKVSLGPAVLHTYLPRNTHCSSVICQAEKAARFQPFILHKLNYKAAWTHTNLSIFLLNQSLLQLCKENEEIKPILYLRLPALESYVSGRTWAA